MTILCFIPALQCWKVSCQWPPRISAIILIWCFFRCIFEGNPACTWATVFAFVGAVASVAVADSYWFVDVDVLVLVSFWLFFHCFCPVCLLGFECLVWWRFAESFLCSRSRSLCSPLHTNRTVLLIGSSHPVAHRTAAGLVDLKVRNFADWLEWLPNSQVSGGQNKESPWTMVNIDVAQISCPRNLRDSLMVYHGLPHPEVVVTWDWWGVSKYPLVVIKHGAPLGKSVSMVIYHIQFNIPTNIQFNVPFNVPLRLYFH